MYLSHLTIENFRCFGDGDTAFQMTLKAGVTALVGENDSGKTAVIDALRFALGTTDQEWYRLEDSDFHGGEGSRQIRIACKFDGLNPQDLAAFVEYLTYSADGIGDPIFYLNWIAENTGQLRRGRAYRRVEVHSGKDGAGPILAPEVRELLRATYLRPLRDAEHALSAGRGSRLAQVLRHADSITLGRAEHDPDLLLKDQDLSVLGIGRLVDSLLQKQKGVDDTRTKIDKTLDNLSLRGDGLKSDIEVSGTRVSNEARLLELLEKLDLRLGGDGRLGLGSNNILFMACELLLLAQDEIGSTLLLIEEPEAHLHAQRQLRAMKFLQRQAETTGIQIIVTTHSPNLASAIELENMVMIHNRCAFSMAEGLTELGASDYRFLKRFLDVTKANLFFARAVMIVEGDAENILIPTLARLVGRDFTEYGVSIVNVGGIGLRRYARIFQRKMIEEDAEIVQLEIPVACVTDMDVMPDCAPVIIGMLEEGAKWPEKKGRRWRARRDMSDDGALQKERNAKVEKASGQSVKTFVSDVWTLEYDLSLGPKDENGDFKGGFAEDVYVASCLAQKDERINSKKVEVSDVEAAAIAEFAELRAQAKPGNECTVQEVVACHAYQKLAMGGVSKPVAVQYLAERLQRKFDEGKLNREVLRKRLPTYLTNAIDYVTGAGQEAPNAEEEKSASE